MYTLYIVLYFSTDCCHYTLHFASDLLDESDLDLLTQELTAVKQKWYEIGVDLENEMNNIRRQYSDPDVCLRESLKVELQHSYPTTWRNIVDALRSPGVAESQLSDQLEAKYCPSEFINNILLYFSEYNGVQHYT